MLRGLCWQSALKEQQAVRLGLANKLGIIRIPLRAGQVASPLPANPFRKWCPAEARPENA